MMSTNRARELLQGNMDAVKELDQILSSAVSFYRKRSPNLQTLGPLSQQAAHDAAALAQASQFRAAYAAGHAPYLEDQFHMGLDTQLEQMSPASYFVVTDDGEITGALRVRLAVHEFPCIAPQLASVASSLASYAEYSRLMVSRSTHTLGAGRLLVAAATQWVLAQDSRLGIVALCRNAAARVFATYGLRPHVQRPIAIERRGAAPYRLMAATWSMIFEHLSTSPPHELPSRPVGAGPESERQGWEKAP